MSTTPVEAKTPLTAAEIMANNEKNGSLDFVYAMLLMKLSGADKDAAMSKIADIKAIRQKSSEIADAINTLRNVRLTGFNKDDIKSGEKSTVKDICQKWDLKCPDKPIKDDIDVMITSLKTKSEELTAGIQQEMVFIQDFMGQYSSKTQGASTVLNQGLETRKHISHNL